MRIDRIEIFPDAGKPAGSYAIIKLFGVGQLDAPPVFRIEPASPEGSAPYDGWPNGELRPLGMHAGRDVAELLVGPDVLRARALRRGVDVRLRMPALGVDVTFAWPDFYNENAGDTACARIAVGVPDDGNLNGTPVPLVLPSATSGLKLPRPTPESPSERGLSRLQLRGSALRPPGEPPKLAVTPNDAVAMPPLRPPGAVPPPARQQAQEHPRKATIGAMLRRPGMDYLPFALGLVIVAAIFVMFLRTAKMSEAGPTLFTALRTGAAVSGQTGPDRSRASAVLGQIFNISETSPGGTIVTDDIRREALVRASTLLASAQTAEQREAATYWLRVALSEKLAEPRLVWAITQLGSAYAASDNGAKPNYQAAHLLWNWAAQAGDAHAACFLGSLHERGLGTPADLARARAIYQRARQMGGCPGLEQALLRVEKSR